MLVTCLKCKKPVFVSSSAVASGEAQMQCATCRTELLISPNGHVQAVGTADALTASEAPVPVPVQGKASSGLSEMSTQGEAAWSPGALDEDDDGELGEEFETTQVTSRDEVDEAHEVTQVTAQASAPASQEPTAAPAAPQAPIGAPPPPAPADAVAAPQAAPGDAADTGPDATVEVDAPQPPEGRAENTDPAVPLPSGSATAPESGWVPPPPAPVFPTASADAGASAPVHPADEGVPGSPWADTTEGDGAPAARDTVQELTAITPHPSPEGEQAQAVEEIEDFEELDEITAVTNRATVTPSIQLPDPSDTRPETTEVTQPAPGDDTGPTGREEFGGKRVERPFDSEPSEAESWSVAPAGEAHASATEPEAAAEKKESEPSGAASESARPTVVAARAEAPPADELDSGFDELGEAPGNRWVLPLIGLLLVVAAGGGLWATGILGDLSSAGSGEADTDEAVAVAEEASQEESGEAVDVEDIDPEGGEFDEGTASELSTDEGATKKPKRAVRRTKKSPAKARPAKPTKAAKAPSTKAVVTAAPAPPKPTPKPTPKPASKPTGVGSEAEQHYKQGNLYLKEKKVALAIAELKKCVGVNPKHGLAYRSLGVAYYMLGREKSAVQAYQRFVTLAPGHKDVPKVKQIIENYQKKQGG